ncbi:MAG: hypothetical protein WED04_00410 [Promethearchaeati archaeon SRVP18_Atabeyarchaeia-1]
MADEPRDGKKGHSEDNEFLWRKKKVELLQKESGQLLETRQMLKEWIRSSIDQYGNLPQKVRERIDSAGRNLGITVDDVIAEVMAEQVVGKSGKIDQEKLALLLLQEAQALREKNGGVMTFAELQLALEEGPLSGKVKPGDVKKAVEILTDRKLIPGPKELDSGLILVRFFPIEISPDQNAVLTLAGEKGWITLEEVMVRTGWSRERSEIALKELEDSGISRADPNYSTGKKWYFPGLTGH